MLYDYYSALTWLMQISLTLVRNVVLSGIIILSFVYFLLFVRFIKLVIQRKCNKLDANRNHAILITGATSGFGLALSRYYHRLGFTILAAYYDQSEQGFEELEKLGYKHGRMHLIHMDVSSMDSIKKSRVDVDNILAEYKDLKLYCLVNNAGISSSQMPIFMESRNILKKICETNLIGPLLTVREFMPALIEGEGRIINVSSGLSNTPNELYTPYGATKVGLLYASRCLAVETTRYGVKTIVLCPGNLIKNTNIVKPMLNRQKQLWHEYDQDEKILYKGLYTVIHEGVAAECEKLDRFLKGEKNLQAFKLVGNRDSLPEKNQQVAPSFFRSIIMQIMDIIETSTGSSDTTSIEDSSVMEAFDDAIRLANPPTILFPGNRWYQHIVGPSCLYMPSAVWDYFFLNKTHPKASSLPDFIKRRQLARIAEPVPDTDTQ